MIMHFPSRPSPEKLSLILISQGKMREISQLSELDNFFCINRFQY